MSVARNAVGLRLVKGGDSQRECRPRYHGMRRRTSAGAGAARRSTSVGSMNTEVSLAPQMEPLTRAELIESLEKGCKRPEDFRIGTEHEKFGFYDKDYRRLDYHDISILLNTIGSRFGWDPVMEDGNIIGLTKDKMNISLEPGGQLELSGAPLKTVRETCQEVHMHLNQVENVASEMGIGFLGSGFDPMWKREDIPMMPKGRYQIMKNYMPKVGSMGLDMMFRTSTIQVNLDFESERDMIRKMRISLALQSVATALFANSPFTDGKPNGYLSMRSQVWTDTDNQRAGILPFVFEEDFGFEKYVDYALDVPMYFLYRDNRYVDVTGLSFRELKDGKLEGYPGEFATVADWNNHLTTIFPEVRLKKYIEMRGADGGPWNNICALPAFWVGILYDDQALDEAEQLIRDWTVDDIQKMRDDVTRLALQTEVKGRKLQDVAKDVVKISKNGLFSRGFDEAKYLKKLEETAESGKSPAEILLDKYHNTWNGDITKIYSDQSY